MLKNLENRKSYSYKYKLIINGQPRHFQFTMMRSKDQKHFVLYEKDIDDEIRKEKQQLKALNTEKELARRDELTGVKNKTAYNELLSRQALFMLFLPSMPDTTLQTSR